MDTTYRDNAIEKNRLLLRLTLVWALSSTLAVMVLAILSFYTLTHRQVHWLPVCTGAEFSLGDGNYSPEYLKQMTQKAADLRLTYSPQTIDGRYKMLSQLIPANLQQSFTKILESERKTVHDKNISSVFYAQKVDVDMTNHKGQIEGLLHRTSHGLQLKPEKKAYQLEFSFTQGLLNLVSMQEVQNAS